MQYKIGFKSPPLFKSSGYKVWEFKGPSELRLASETMSHEPALGSRYTRPGKVDCYHPTARHRDLPSVPLQEYLIQNKIQSKRNSSLYHGIGKDESGAKLLEEGGRLVYRYDPFHPNSFIRILPPPMPLFDEIYSIYTLNVVGKKAAKTILEEIEVRMKDDGVAIIAVRNDLR